MWRDKLSLGLIASSMLLVACLFILAGFGGTDTYNTSLKVGLYSAAIFLTSLLGGIYLIRKRASLTVSFIFVLGVLVASSLVLASSNCSRCRSQDAWARMQMTTWRAPLEIAYEENGSAYPESLPPLQNKFVQLSQFRYSRTGDSYNLCTTIKLHTFYGFSINEGEEYCVGPAHD